MNHARTLTKIAVLATVLLLLPIAQASVPGLGTISGMKWRHLSDTANFTCNVPAGVLNLELADDGATYNATIAFALGAVTVCAGQAPPASWTPQVVTFGNIQLQSGAYVGTEIDGCVTKVFSLRPSGSAYTLRAESWDTCTSYIYDRYTGTVS